jgi:hypothetical protein
MVDGAQEKGELGIAVPKMGGEPVIDKLNGLGCDIGAGALKTIDQQMQFIQQFPMQPQVPQGIGVSIPLHQFLFVIEMAPGKVQQALRGPTGGLFTETAICR